MSSHARPQKQEKTEDEPSLLVTVSLRFRPGPTGLAMFATRLPRSLRPLWRPVLVSAPSERYEDINRTWSALRLLFPAKGRLMGSFLRVGSTRRARRGRPSCRQALEKDLAAVPSSPSSTHDRDDDHCQRPITLSPSYPFLPCFTRRQKAPNSGKNCGATGAACKWRRSAYLVAQAEVRSCD